MGSLKKEPRGTLSLLFALLQGVGKLLMDSEPIISNRICSLVWGVSSPKQYHGCGSKWRWGYIVSAIDCGLLGHQIFNHIHVFISIPRLWFSGGNQIRVCSWWKVTGFSIGLGQGSVEPLCNFLTQKCSDHANLNPILNICKDTGICLLCGRNPFSLTRKVFILEK